MEDVIKKYFCNFCMRKNNCKNCMKIKIEKNNNILIYRCVNFNRNKNKKLPYYVDFDYKIKSDKEVKI